MAVASRKDWRDWSAYEWSDALLDHYFRRLHPTDPAVRLLVTLDEEFSDVVGDFETPPEEIVREFVKKTNRSVSGGMGYWEKAESKCRKNGPPAYLPYLLLGCIVAGDAGDSDDSDENSFLLRFDLRTDGKGSQRIEVMAKLWKHLSAWLEENRSEYRSLELPDPGGWTRIGHTTRLTFPSRKDQLALHQVLSENGLIVDSPPIGPTLGAIRSNSRRFRPRFLEEFELFETDYLEERPSSELFESPFWGAVVRATRLSVAQTGSSTYQRWSLAAEDDDFDFELTLVTDRPEIAFDTSITLEPAVGHHDWPFEASGAAAAAVLNLPEKRFGQLSGLIRGGVLPFGRNAHGALEIVGKQGLAAAPTAVVRDDLVQEFVEYFGGSPGLSDAHGWTVVRGTRMRTFASAALEETLFANTFVLHEAPADRKIRPIGGLRVDGGLYGRKSMVPSFVAPGATDLLVETSNGVWIMQKDEDIFSIPTDALGSDLDGKIEISADFPDGTRRQTFDFHAVPVAEKYRWPRDTDHLVVEGCMVGSHLGEAADTAPPLLRNADEVQYLGRDVGIFSSDSASAAWEVVKFGRSAIAQACDSALLPQGVNPDKGMARRWRKQLSTAEYFDSAHKRAAETAIRFKGGDSSASNTAPVELATPVVEPHPALSDVVEVLVASANSRAGLSVRGFLDRLNDNLHVDQGSQWDVLRSWIEGGYLQDAITTRFRTRKLYPVQPILELFRTDMYGGARLSGLSLAQTISTVCSIAEKLGVQVAPQPAQHSAVPSTLVFRAADLNALRELSHLSGIPCSAAAELDASKMASDGITTQPVTHARRHSPRSYASASTASVQLWANPRSPHYWEAIADGESRWYFHLNNAQFASAALHGEPVVSRSAHSLVAENAYLPLPVARRINLVAPAISGPGPDGRYRYFCPTVEMAQEVESCVETLTQQTRNNGE